MYAASLTVAVWTLTSKRVLKREKPWSALPLADNCSSNVWESPQPLPVIQSNKTIRLCTSLNRVCTIYTWGRVSHWSLVVPCPAYLLESALLIHIHLWAGLQLGLPPVHHQYYNTIVLSVMYLKNFELFFNAVLVFDCIAWLGCWGQTWAKRSPSINLCLPHSLWAQVIDSIGRTNGYNEALIHAFQLVVTTFVE